MIEAFLTTEQVASLLQVHPFTVLKFIKQGRLKGVKLGRVYRIKENDVKDFLEANMLNNSIRSSSSTKKSNQESFEAEVTDKNKEGRDENDSHYYIL